MMAQKRILVTGSSGFVGGHIVAALSTSGFEVVAAARSSNEFCKFRNVIEARMPDLEGGLSIDWRELLRGVDVVVHAAGLAHASTDDPRHDVVNHLAVARLAEAACASDIKHFVFISSLAAQTGSAAVEILTERSEPRPANAYGRAKLAAEVAIRDSGVRYTILRPTAIYGEGAKGSFASLLRLANLPIPLPFGRLDAPRSFLSIENLGHAVLCVLENPAAENKTFLVADPSPLSVHALVRRMREVGGRRANLLPVPGIFLKGALTAIGWKSLWDRIGEPLVVSSARLQAIGWCPRPARFLPQLPAP